MVDDVEGGGQVEEEGSDEFVIFSCCEPDVIQLYEGRDSAVVGEAAMVIGMEQVVGDEVLEDLVKHGIFYEFTNLWNVRDWAIILS